MDNQARLEQHSSVHSSPLHPQRTNLAGSSDRRDRVKARFRAAYEKLWKQTADRELIDSQTGSTQTPEKGNSWHHNKHRGADMARDAHFVESLGGTVTFSHPSR